MIEISVAVIAFAFVVLVVYLTIALGSARVALDQLTKTLQSTQQQLNLISIESIKLLQNTQKITADLEQKVESLDALFQLTSAISNKALNVVGAHKSSPCCCSCSCCQDREVEKDKKVSTVDAVIECIGLGAEIWKKIKS